MKIGLVTIYSVPNYGSVLQAFATQKILESMGHECVILDYQYPNEWHYQQGAQRKSWKRELVKKLGLKPLHRKENRLKAFRREHFNFSKPYANLEEMTKEDWSKYDAFVVGSDQVWNPRFLRGDKAFMLSFVPEDKHRFSIASSFAQNALPTELVDKYKRELSKFKAISVREQNGIGIINYQLSIDKPVQICIDPTLLLSKEEWMKLIPRSVFKQSRPYILVYMLKYAFDPQPYIWEVVSYYKQKMDADVIVLMGNEPNAGVEMIDATDSSIPQFIDLFNNANLVITSSFHGTAFALNFGRPLISIIPNNAGDDRQSSLLKSVNAENSIVPVGTEVEIVNPYYNTDTVLEFLDNLRKKNKNWIKDNIICGY